MTPKPPHLRHHENPSRLDHIERREFESALGRKLRNKTQLKHPPSKHVRAHREYERAYFYARGFELPASQMGYHLWSDAARSWREAHNLLTNEGCATGSTKKTPRRALAILADALGFRYLRGLASIAGALADDERLDKFKRERLEFQQEFDKKADAAHAANDSGQNPGAALEVVWMFQRELLALSSWWELAGNKLAADLLRDEVQLK